MEPEFPLEFVIHGTPVSAQTKRAESREQWKQRVKEASYSALPENQFATEAKLAATIYYFPDTPMEGDIDNIVKYTLDGMSRHIYLDDRLVERVVVQKFEPGNIFAFAAPTAALLKALDGEKPVTYIRLSTNPFEELG